MSSWESTHLWVYAITFPGVGSEGFAKAENGWLANVRKTCVLVCGFAGCLLRAEFGYLLVAAASGE